MVVNPASCKSKMVVVFATAVALGASAVAACVVPWLYCKPGDNTDDDREATAIGEDNTDLGVEVGLRVPTFNGPNIVKIQFLDGQNDTANSTSFGEYFPRNPINGASRSPVRADQVQPQCQGDVETCISRISNFVGTAVGTKNKENASEDIKESRDARSLDEPITNSQILESHLEYPDSTELGSSNANEYTEESSDDHSWEVVVKDTRVDESPMPNSTSTKPYLKVKVDYNGTDSLQNSESSNSTSESSTNALQTSESSDPTGESSADTLQTTESSDPTGESSADTLQTTESSNPTEESSTETTLTGSSESSDLDHSENIIQLNKQTAEKPRSSNIARCVESTSRMERTLKVESMKSESSDPGVLIPESSESESIDQIKEETTPPLQTTEESDSTNFSTNTTDGTFASRELHRSFDSTKTTGIADFESSKISKDLDTIQEVSSCSESSEEVLPRAASSQAAFQEVSSCSESSEEVLPRAASSQAAFPKSTPNHQDTNAKKMSRPARIASRFSSGFKRFFHGIRLNRTRRSSSEELLRELHNESVHSVSAGEKLPAGHSTLVPEDERLLNNIGGKRSMTAYGFLPRPLKEPRICLHDHRNRSSESRFHGKEVPLEKTKDSSACEEKTFNGTSDGTRQVFRKVKEFLRPRISKISEDGTSSSDSLNSKSDTTKPVERDGNHNFLSASLTAVHDANVDENREFIGDSEAILNFPETNDGKLKRRSFKNIFKFGNRDRIKGNGKVSCFGRKKTGANSVPAEFQRNSAGMSSKHGEHRNAKFESVTSESRADSNSYQESDFTTLHDERNLRQPCTEL